MYNWKSFNVNNNIRVKLTEKGLIHWMDDFNKYMPETGKVPKSYFTNQIDEEGYVTFQMWCFMEHFGAETSIGMATLFETNILIDIE